MIYGTAAGRIVRDAELRHTENSTVLGFTVACDVGFGDGKHPVYVKCSMWGKRGQAVEAYVKKGNPVTVIGTMDLKSWDSNGKSGTDLELNVAELVLQGSSNAQSQHDNAQSGNAPVDNGNVMPDNGIPDLDQDDIPF
jgi:single-strand DNA-binding protein